MCRATLLLTLFFCALSSIQAQYIPPDLYQEKYMPSIGFWKDHGQVIGTDKSKLEDVKYYTIGPFCWPTCAPSRVCPSHCLW